MEALSVMRTMKRENLECMSAAGLSRAKRRMPANSANFELAGMRPCSAPDLKVGISNNEGYRFLRPLCM
jgi:hypothetical protein